MIFKDEAEAQAACEWWQKQLRLADWGIKVQIARQANMPLENCQATCTPCERNRSALVRLLDPTDYPTNTEWHQDHESSLVHELLHLFWPRCERDTADDIKQDQAVESQAEAYIRLRRVAYPEPPWK